MVTEKSKQGLSKIYKTSHTSQTFQTRQIFTEIVHPCSPAVPTQGRITNALPSTLVYDWDLADSCLALYLRDAVHEVEDIE